MTSGAALRSFPGITLSRRSFIAHSAAAATVAAVAAKLRGSAWARPIGAADAVRVAVVGLHFKGSSHLRQLLAMPGVRVVALCDVDPLILAKAVKQAKAKEQEVFATTDARELLDRPDIDALVIATGTYWHALQTIWACQAGKDVYVEKPASHDIWEGRQMIEAAARYGRIVQVGLQLRSATGVPEAIEYLRQGHLGPMRHIQAICYKPRPGIGRKLPWYPGWLDFNRFCGPAPVAPLERAALHYDWHWMWSTGGGDLANMGVHMLDLARRFGRFEGPPRRVISLGGRYGVEDVGETPNTQIALFDFPGLPLIFESRGLPSAPYRGTRLGIIVQCEGGYYAGYGEGAAFDNAGKRLVRFPSDNGAGHFGNFFAAMRSRRTADLACPVATGHASTCLAHYGNISYRLGQAAADDASLDGFPLAAGRLREVRQHLLDRGIDLARRPLRGGPWLEIDPVSDGVARVEGAPAAVAERARYLLKEAERPPFIIPERA